MEREEHLVSPSESCFTSKREGEEVTEDGTKEREEDGNDEEDEEESDMIITWRECDSTNGTWYGMFRVKILCALGMIYICYYSYNNECEYIL